MCGSSAMYTCVHVVKARFTCADMSWAELWVYQRCRFVQNLCSMWVIGVIGVHQQQLRCYFWSVLGDVNHVVAECGGG
jgi:hypothetical protein